MKKEAMKFTDKAVELFKDVYDISGGSVVVTELPEVGEEHIVYELRESKPASYDWVAMLTHQMRDDGVILHNNHILIFDTYEQMTSTINNLNTENIQATLVYCYLKNEDKMYKVEWFGKTQEWRYGEVIKFSPYVFNTMIDYDDHLCVLKSYEGLDETPSHLGYWGTLLDGTEIRLRTVDENSTYYAFILHQVTYDEMSSFISTGSTVHSVTQLPTAQELVANYLDELVENDGFILVEIDGVVKYNEQSSNNYRWVSELENFYRPWEEGAEPTEIYTGELDWNSHGDPTFDTIQYQELFNMSEEAFWYFKPAQEGEKISYWIYSNNTWTNVDEIGKPSNVGTIYVSTDSYYALTQEKFYGNGKELEVEFVDTTDGGEISTGYAIIKGVPIDTQTELTVSDWPTNGIDYNGQLYNEQPILVIGAGHMVLSFMMQ